MQYYNSLSNRKKGSDNEKRAVCLNEVLYTCIQKSAAIYPCSINYTECDEVLYGAESIEMIIDKTVNTLDEVCRKHNELYIRLEKSNDGDNGILSLMNSENAVITRLLYPLCKGKITSVISDSSANVKIAGRIDEFFKAVCNHNS